MISNHHKRYYNLTNCVYLLLNRVFIKWHTVCNRGKLEDVDTSNLKAGK